MESASRAGRLVGALIIIQMFGSGMVNFVLEGSLSGSPGFLVNAASHSRQLGLAVLFGLITEALWVGIAITAFPILFQRTQRMALWFVALTVVSLAVAVVENVGVMSMVSLSGAYANANTAGREQLQTVGVIVSSARDWPHFISRIFIGAAAFTFYAALYRFILVPRAIAGFSVIAAVLMMVAVAMPLFDHKVVFVLLAPMGLSQLILAVWLLAKGFREQPGH